MTYKTEQERKEILPRKRLIGEVKFCPYCENVILNGECTVCGHR